MSCLACGKGKGNGSQEQADQNQNMPTINNNNNNQNNNNIIQNNGKNNQQQKQKQQSQQQHQQQQQLQQQEGVYRAQQVKKNQKFVELPASIIEYYKQYSRNDVQTMRIKKAQGYKFHLDARYQVYDMIGNGAYGKVVAAIDKMGQEDEQIVAIKKIEQPFEHKIFAKRALRELKISRLLQHDNINSIKTVQLPISREEFEDLYIVSELMETDLGTVIKSPQPISDDQIKFFVYQILRGLKYIHSAKILHRDLKPKNLLVNRTCDLKICDFGLSRTINPNLKCNIITDYVATRWYRAPELLLQWPSYSDSVDVWSVGCIMAELIRKRPLFPGNNTREQISLIFDMIGTPIKNEINMIPKQNIQNYVRSLPKKDPKYFEDLFPNASPEARDLLKNLLVFNPVKRITVQDALRHPYLSQLHEDDDEPTTDPVDPIDFEFENYDLTIQQLKDLIYEEILLYHFPEFKQNYELKKQKKQSIINHILKNENSQLIDNDSDDNSLDEV